MVVDAVRSSRTDNFTTVTELETSWEVEVVSRGNPFVCRWLKPVSGAKQKLNLQRFPINYYRINFYAEAIFYLIN